MLQTPNKVSEARVRLKDLHSIPGWHAQTRRLPSCRILRMEDMGWLAPSSYAACKSRSHSSCEAACELAKAFRTRCTHPNRHESLQDANRRYHIQPASHIMSRGGHHGQNWNEYCEPQPLSRVFLRYIPLMRAVGRAGTNIGQTRRRFGLALWVFRGSGLLRSTNCAQPRPGLRGVERTGQVRVTSSDGAGRCKRLRCGFLFPHAQADNMARDLQWQTFSMCWRHVSEVPGHKTAVVLRYRAQPLESSFPFHMLAMCTAGKHAGKRTATRNLIPLRITAGSR